MIFLITGVPGAGKTLNTIKFVNEDEQFKDRPVFYFGIKELTLPWTPLDEQQVMEWYYLPRGAVLVIDEAQNVFPPRNVRQEAPPHVAHLNTHRHYGIDIVLITQHPRLIDTSVKPLVGQHQHFERKYGWTRVKRVIFEQCQDNTQAKGARELAQIKQINFDRKYFDVYKSAEVHTHKARIPSKLLWMGAALIGIVGFWLFGFSHFLGGDDPAEATVTDSAPQQSEMPVRERPVEKATTAEEVASLPLDPQEYLKLYEPRIKGIPHTAPIYDDLVRPVEAPKTLCVSWRREGIDHCQCFTQQITKVNTSYSACKNVVNNRMWDPTYKSVSYSASGNVLEDG